MQALLASNPAPIGRNALAHLGRYASATMQARRPVADDAGFIELLGAYRRSGGLVRLAEIAALLDRRRTGTGVAALAAWLARQSVISFEWQAQAWLPWFQFKHPGYVPAPALAAVIAALSPVYGGWDLACWFARPNSSLADMPPVDLLDINPEAVLHAARAQRLC